MADHADEGTMDLQSVSDPVGGAPSGGRRAKWLVPAVVALVVVVVVVAGLVGWRVVENRRHGAALDSCSRAVKALQGKTGPARMARYREAAGIKADQVKDAKTVVAMARSVKDAEGIRQRTIRCKASMSTGDLNAAAGQARKIDGKYAAVDRAAKAVTASRDAKTLEDAKKEEASRLLADSDGKVADNATRDGLQQAIGQAGQAKGDGAKACRDAADALQAAIDRVNASVQAKSQADQQAAAQAQAAQQQAQRQGATRHRQASSSNARRGSTQTRRPTYRPSGNQGGGGGGSAPQNQGNDKSWEDKWNDFIHRPDNTMHGCNPDGSCGIG